MGGGAIIGEEDREKCVCVCRKYLSTDWCIIKLDSCFG